jgi:hypothetical protein
MRLTYNVFFKYMYFQVHSMINACTSIERLRPDVQEELPDIPTSE